MINTSLLQQKGDRDRKKLFLHFFSRLGCIFIAQKCPDLLLPIFTKCLPLALDNLRDNFLIFNLVFELVNYAQKLECLTFFETISEQQLSFLDIYKKAGHLITNFSDTEDEDFVIAIYKLFTVAIELGGEFNGWVIKNPKEAKNFMENLDINFSKGTN